MKFPELTGGWRIVQATKELNFATMSGKEGQINRAKMYAVELAESKAINRCIRKALNVKGAYTIDELKKPFIVAYPVLDARDPDAKRALIAGSIAASNLLYGSGLQLNSGRMEALPEASEQRHNVDVTTGEVVDAGYEPDDGGAEQQTGNVQKPWEAGQK
jgi:hypothetical protein